MIQNYQVNQIKNVISFLCNLHINDKRCVQSEDINNNDILEGRITNTIALNGAAKAPKDWLIGILGMNVNS